MEKISAEFGDWTTSTNGEVGIDCGIESPEDIRRVRELHRLHRGQAKATADLHYLEHARRLDRYGVDIHPVKVSATLIVCEINSIPYLLCYVIFYLRIQTEKIFLLE